MVLSYCQLSRVNDVSQVDNGVEEEFTLLQIIDDASIA